MKKTLRKETIAAMKEKRARDKARDEAAKKTDNTENETTDWKEAMKEWATDPGKVFRILVEM